MGCCGTTRDPGYYGVVAEGYTLADYDAVRLSLSALPFPTSFNQVAMYQWTSGTLVFNRFESFTTQSIVIQQPNGMNIGAILSQPSGQGKILAVGLHRFPICIFRPTGGFPTGYTCIRTRITEPETVAFGFGYDWRITSDETELLGDSQQGGFPFWPRAMQWAASAAGDPLFPGFCCDLTALPP